MRKRGVGGVGGVGGWVLGVRMASTIPMKTLIPEHGPADHPGNVLYRHKYSSSNATSCFFNNATNSSRNERRM